MSPRFEDATLAILAGGRGTRLGGVAKGLLELDGRTFLARLRDLSPSFAETVLVTSDPAPYEGAGLRVVADVVQGRGAPGGLHAALAAASTPWVFVAAVDLPLLSSPVVRLLADERTAEVDVVMFEREPLAAFYRSALAPLILPRLGGGPSVMEALSGARIRTLPAPEGDALTNVNSEAELSDVGAVRPSGRRPMPG